MKIRHELRMRLFDQAVAKPLDLSESGRPHKKWWALQGSTSPPWDQKCQLSWPYGPWSSKRAGQIR